MTADPFIIETLESTHSSVETERFAVPRFQELSRLIIKPLGEICKQPELVQSRHRKIMKFRFRIQYLSPEANWELPLGTHNAFLERFCQTEIPTLAEEISREDHDLYRHLTIEAIALGHNEINQVRHDLGTRWNQLSRSVEESLLSESKICQGIAQLSQVRLPPLINSPTNTFCLESSRKPQFLLINCRDPWSKIKQHDEAHSQKV